LLWLLKLYTKCSCCFHTHKFVCAPDHKADNTHKKPASMKQQQTDIIQQNRLYLWNYWNCISFLIRLSTSHNSKTTTFLLTFGYPWNNLTLSTYFWLS